MLHFPSVDRTFVEHKKRADGFNYFDMLNKHRPRVYFYRTIDYHGRQLRLPYVSASRCAHAALRLLTISTGESNFTICDKDTYLSILDGLKKNNLCKLIP